MCPHLVLALSSAGQHQAAAARPPRKPRAPTAGLLQEPTETWSFGQGFLRTVISQISKILRRNGRWGKLYSQQLILPNDRLTKTKTKTLSSSIIALS